MMIGAEDRALRYRKEICARTKAARIKAHYSQAKVAKALGISLEAYKTYEKRSPLPHYLIEPWTMIMHVSVEWLITGSDVSNVIPMTGKINLNSANST